MYTQSSQSSCTYDVVMYTNISRRREESIKYSSKPDGRVTVCIMLLLHIVIVRVRLVPRTRRTHGDKKPGEHCASTKIIVGSYIRTVLDRCAAVPFRAWSYCNYNVASSPHRLVETRLRAIDFENFGPTLRCSAYSVCVLGLCTERRVTVIAI